MKGVSQESVTPCPLFHPKSRTCRSSVSAAGVGGDGWTDALMGNTVVKPLSIPEEPGVHFLMDRSLNPGAVVLFLRFSEAEGLCFCF